jgi:hypothetical protein
LNYRKLVALFLSVATLSVQAEQRWFEIELLVFERNVEIQDIKEHLLSQEIVVNTDDSINLLKPIRETVCVQGEACLSKQNPTVITEEVFDPQENDFQRLDSSYLQLAEQRKRLEKHASFKPVFHMAWRMPVKGPQASKPIHLFAGENFAFNIQKRQKNQQSALDSNMTDTDAVATELNNTKAAELIIEDAMVKDVVVNTADVRSEQTEISPSELLQIELPIVLTDKWAIDGNFKIFLNHYLYIDSQLIIRKEVTQDIVQDKQVVQLIDDENGVQIASQSIAPIGTNIPINLKKQVIIKEILFNQNRRLRSEEIHYLDHPLMGIIVQIRKIPESEQ